MPKTYGFTSERDVRRARRASRMVLDRRVLSPARFAKGAGAGNAAGSESTYSPRCEAVTRGHDGPILTCLDAPHK